MIKTVINRGDVFYANLGFDGTSRQGGVRPIVIISNQQCNRYSPISKHQQLMACKALAAYGVIKIKYHGMPKKRYFKFDSETFDKLYRDIESHSGIPDDFDDVIKRPFRMSY